MIALAILVEMIRLSLAMTTVTEPTPLAPWLATMAPEIRLEWRPVHSGLAAATWTREMVRRPGTLSAWNFFWRLTR